MSEGKNIGTKVRDPRTCSMQRWEMSLALFLLLLFLWRRFPMIFTDAIDGKTQSGDLDFCHSKREVLGRSTEFSLASRV